MNNIEVFNRVVAATFAKLYSEFPKPITILVSEIRAEAEITKDGWWEEKNAGRNSVTCAVQWLKDEGYVRFADKGGGTQFADVILTSKGFAALNRSPESLTSQPTIGEHLRSLTATATKEGVGVLVKAALAYATS